MFNIRHNTNTRATNRQKKVRYTYYKGWSLNKPFKRITYYHANVVSVFFACSFEKVSSLLTNGMSFISVIREWFGDCAMINWIFNVWKLRANRDSQPLKAFFGEETFDVSTMRYWVRMVKKNLINLCNLCRLGRPKVGQTEELKLKIDQKFHENRRITQRPPAEQLRISQATLTRLFET